MQDLASRFSKIFRGDTPDLHSGRGRPWLCPPLNFSAVVAPLAQWSANREASCNLRRCCGDTVIAAAALVHKSVNCCDSEHWLPAVAARSRVWAIGQLIYLPWTCDKFGTTAKDIACDCCLSLYLIPRHTSLGLHNVTRHLHYSITASWRQSIHKSETCK